MILYDQLQKIDRMGKAHLLRILLALGDSRKLYPPVYNETAEANWDGAVGKLNVDS